MGSAELFSANSGSAVAGGAGGGKAVNAGASCFTGIAKLVALNLGDGRWACKSISFLFSRAQHMPQPSAVKATALTSKAAKKTQREQVEPSSRRSPGQ